MCSGHLLFEMAFGHELDAAHPGPQHLVSAQSPAIIEVSDVLLTSQGRTQFLINKGNNSVQFRSV